MNICFQSNCEYILQVDFSYFDPELNKVDKEERLKFVQASTKSIQESNRALASQHLWLYNIFVFSLHYCLREVVVSVYKKVTEIKNF